jgi:hypothetical protein
VLKAGGTVEIDSEPGCGTTFVITLPVLTPDDASDDRGAESHLNAWVVLEDRRLSAYMLALLRAARINGRIGQWPPDPASTLLIIDSRHCSNGQIDTYLQEDCSRLAIVIGERVHSRVSEQVVFLEAKPTPAKIRDALDMVLCQTASGTRAQ